LSNSGEHSTPTLYSGTILTIGPGSAFPDTHWTMVIAAGKDTPTRDQALNALCQSYLVSRLRLYPAQRPQRG
jgi:hypothetical protein